MDLKEMIEKGEAVLAEADAAELKKKEDQEKRYQDAVEAVYARVREILPEALREYLVTTGEEIPEFEYLDLDPEGGFGYVPWHGQHMQIAVPECSPVRVFVDIKAGKVSKYQIPNVIEGDVFSDVSGSYYSFDQKPFIIVEDQNIALAMAARQHQWNEKSRVAYLEARNSYARLAAEREQARNDSSRVDYLGEAIKMMDQFHNTGYPNDLECAMAYSMMGILEQLKGIK